MERILGLSNVSKKYQITLTKEVREKLGIKEGDKVVFVEKNGDIVIKKAKITF